MNRSSVIYVRTQIEPLKEEEAAEVAGMTLEDLMGVFVAFSLAMAVAVLAFALELLVNQVVDAMHLEGGLFYRDIISGFFFWYARLLRSDL